jgi:peptide/nickel transport system substrate-binding protein
MPTRFGLRQLVLLLIALGCSVAIVVAMVQNNRRMAAPAAPQSTAATVQATGTQGVVSDWARPGVPVTRSPRWTFEDPTHDSLRGVDGDFVEALEASPQTLTPFFATDAQARRVIQDSVCQTLGEIDRRRGDIRGQIADAWQSDPEGRWLRIKIADTAKFSDGSPVTADDVKFSLDVLRMPGIDADRTRGAVEGIDRIEVISDRVAEFHFKEPRALNVLHALCSLYIVPKHFYEQFTPEELNRSTGLLMGSGPFMLKDLDPANQWRPGSDIVLVRNPHYRPYPHSLRFTVITDPAARLTALRIGDIHIMRGSPDQLPVLRADPEFTAHHRIIADPAIGSSFSAIAWNCAETSILADRRVRLAMTHLLDRQRIASEFYAGSAAIATSPFPVNSQMNDPAITPWPFDPVRAAALLDEAGWTTRNAAGVRTHSDGRTLDIDLAIPQGSRLAEFVALVLKDEAAKAGVRIAIITADMAALADMQRSGRFDGALVSWSHGLPENEPRQLWHTASIAAGDNTSRFSDPEADRIIDRGEREMDTNARMELWHRLHHVLHEEQPFTFLVNPPWIRLVSNRVKGTPNGVGYGRLKLEWHPTGDPQ